MADIYRITTRRGGQWDVETYEGIVWRNGVPVDRTRDDEHTTRREASAAARVLMERIKETGELK